MRLRRGKKDKAPENTEVLKRGHWPQDVVMAEPSSYWSRQKATVIVRSALIGGFVMLVALMIGLYTVVGLYTKLSDSTKEITNPAFKARYADVGSDVVASWFSGGEPPVDLSTDITWPPITVRQDLSGAGALVDASQQSTEGKQKISLSVGRPVLVNAFQVESPDAEFGRLEQLTYRVVINGAPHRVGLTLGIRSLSDASLRPVLVSPPTVMPEDKTSAVAVSARPKDSTRWQPDEAAIKTINEWAKAFTVDDREALKRLSLDSSENVYRGIGSWEFVEGSVNVLWGVVYNNQNMAVVEWSIKTPSVTIKRGEAEEVVDGVQQTQRMLLLMEATNTNLPGISDWGLVGSHDKLEPKGAGVDAELVPTQDNGASGTPTTPSVEITEGVQPETPQPADPAPVPGDQQNSPAPQQQPAPEEQQQQPEAPQPPQEGDRP